MSGIADSVGDALGGVADFAGDALGGIGDFVGDNLGPIGSLAGTFLGGPAGGALGGALGGLFGGGDEDAGGFGAAADWAQGGTMGDFLGGSTPAAGNALLPGSPSIGLGNIGGGGSSIMGELAKMGIGILGSEEQEEAYAEASERARRSADPYMDYRGGAAERLNELMTDPGSIRETPGFEYRLQQGLEGVNRGLGAQGQLKSGRRMAGLMDFSQSFAGQEYQRQFERLGATSGAVNASFGQASQAAIQGGQWSGQGVGQRYETLGQGLGNIFGWG